MEAVRVSARVSVRVFFCVFWFSVCVCRSMMERVGVKADILPQRD